MRVAGKNNAKLHFGQNVLKRIFFYIPDESYIHEIVVSMLSIASFKYLRLVESPSTMYRVDSGAAMYSTPFAKLNNRCESK